MHDLLQRAERILIVRLSALGDLVMASPLIQALRLARPRAHIAWLAQAGHGEAIATHPALDEWIPWDRAHWRELWSQRRYGPLAGEARDFARTLRARNFDTAIDVQGLIKSAIFARASGAPVRIALNPREGSRLLCTHPVQAARNDPGMGSEYRFLANALGLDTAVFDAPAPAAAAADREAARAHLEAAGVQGDYAAICPFTTRPQKHWFAPRWRELARRLHADSGLPVVVLGGPGERDGAAGLCAGEPALVNLAGRTTVREALAIVQGARVAAGVDTGLTHAAIMGGVATVALFGSTRPYLDTGRAGARVLDPPLPCSPCRRRPTCHGAYTCMRALEVDAVLDALNGLRAGK